MNTTYRLLLDVDRVIALARCHMLAFEQDHCLACEWTHNAYAEAHRRLVALQGDLSVNKFIALRTSFWGKA